MSRRKKRLKLKRKVKVVLFIIFLLIVGINILKDKKINNTIQKDLTVELLKKETYLDEVINSSDVTIRDEWEGLIVNYLDLYYKSLIGLESKDVTNLFVKSDSSEAYYIQSAIDLLIYHHKIQLSDMRLTNARYDIEYLDIKEENDIVKINFLVDDYYNFKYLNDIESKAIDVEYEIVIKNVNNEYKIQSLRIVQGNFVMFTNEVDMNDKNSKKEIDNLVSKYKKAIDKNFEDNKKLLVEANNKVYKSNIKCDHGYDRDSAVKYSYKYTDKRNEDYIAYDNVGGNCQSYVSQSLFAGGIPMDIKGDYQWKHYSDEVNEENVKLGRSTSWTGTINFYDYVKNNQGSGMCVDVDKNIFYAEPGDVAHVGYNGFSHAVIVVKQIKDKDGKVVDFLVNSNTASLEDYPFLAYIYPNKRVIKILGYND